MNDNLHGRGPTVLFIASFWMTLLGLALGFTAFSAASTGDSVYSFIAAFLAIGLAAFTFQTALVLTDSDATSRSEASTLVPVRVPVRRQTFR